MSKRLTENEAKKKVIERCKEISTNDETITFLGWKDNKYKNKRTYLVLHNSKINYIWDTTTFSSFLINKITRPNSFSQEYYINKIAVDEGRYFPIITMDTVDDKMAIILINEEERVSSRYFPKENCYLAYIDIVYVLNENYNADLSIYYKTPVE